MTRKNYLITSALTFLLMFIILTAATHFFDDGSVKRGFNLEGGVAVYGVDPIGVGIMYGTLMVATIILYIIQAKRLHDINAHGGLVLLNLLAPSNYGLLFPNFGIWLLLLCIKGTDGPNKYGPDPLAQTIEPKSRLKRKDIQIEP